MDLNHGFLCDNGVHPGKGAVREGGGTSTALLSDADLSAGLLCDPARLELTEGGSHAITQKSHSHSLLYLSKMYRSEFLCCSLSIFHGVDQLRREFASAQVPQ